MSATPQMTEPAAGWWDSLRHFGMLLGAAEAIALETARPVEPMRQNAADDLRRLLTRRDAKDLTAGQFVAMILERVCRLGAPDCGSLLRQPNVPGEYVQLLPTGERLHPRLLWRGRNGGLLPVFLDDEPTLGVHRGRRAVSAALHWLRAKRLPLGLVTNTRQWRLVWAGLDADAAVEWDTDLWFEEGRPGPQLEALRRLVAPETLDGTAPGAQPVLVEAIQKSRRGQAELSARLGENVRAAVEQIVRAHGRALAGVARNDEIYRAAVRVVMRMVVVLFAESRGLLPRENPVYNASYGLMALMEQLEKVAVRGRLQLERRCSAWPRILALFRLIHDGSHHEALAVPAYGGDLFAPGAQGDGADGVAKALHVFETSCFAAGADTVSDAVVHCVLHLLTRTRVRVRQGRGFTTTVVPVDFADLSSEYIGILYEGLLDYELHSAPADDAVVILAVGNQPALPLSRLEALDDAALGQMYNKFKTADDGPRTEDGDEEAETDEASDEDVAAAEGEERLAEDEPEGETETGGEEDAPPDEATEALKKRARAWCERACIAVGLVARPRRRRPAVAADRACENAVDEAFGELVVRIVSPGEWYLVRWGGTRKGAGTFYTRPQLAVPTVQRTLRPLAYEPPRNAGGAPNLDAPPGEWTPRRPEEILSLAVCDPACGSGSFLVAALRFLADAVFASLAAHGRLRGEGDRTLVRLLGEENAPDLSAEWIPEPPESPLFEARLHARLKRHVVERCLHGVDIDPLAVELCRLALWIETMDRDLPFTFLDHKIRVGNALIGCWLDRFQHYPLLAWNREGGDGKDGDGTRSIKKFRAERVIPDARSFLAGPTLFSADRQEEALKAHAGALASLARLHGLPVQDAAERARIYREEFLGSAAWRALKDAFDLWCAVWFWPVERVDCAPLPSTLAAPSEETLAVARGVAAERRFFHWELEFPDVFREDRGGFHAVLGNPPWEVAKPNSKEFFSSVDPLYRGYGKQEALERQRDYGRRDPAVACAWRAYNAVFKAQSNFVKCAAEPFGDPKAEDGENCALARGGAGDRLHDLWRAARVGSSGYADPAHPFRHQGSADINLYKLFLEQAHALLREGGRFGLIVPSSVYSDHGSCALRSLFLDRCRWEWLFGFENRDKIFDIDGRFKFNPLIVEKGGRTERIRTAFMRRDLDDWGAPAESLATDYPRERVEQFSPGSKSLLEVQSSRDLEIIEKIYSHSVLLGDDGPNGWGVKYATEFHMTNDSKLFPPLPKWEEKGYRPDEYSRWLLGDWRPIAQLWDHLGVRPLREGERRCAQPPYDTLPIPRADIPAGFILSRDASFFIAEDAVKDIALPLYEGRMIGQFDFSEKGWVSGKGRRAVWVESQWTNRFVAPQYLMRAEDYEGSAKALRGPLIAYMPISSSTNARTAISCFLRDAPAGHSVNFFVPQSGRTEDALLFVSLLNSYVFDYVLRRRLAGLNLSEFVMVETAVPSRDALRPARAYLLTAVASLSLPSVLFSPSWCASAVRNRPWRRCWAISPRERLRLRAMVDAAIAAATGLDADDMRHILEGCDLPVLGARDGLLLNPKGFWRTDRTVDPELRHAVLAQVAFQDLQRTIDASDDGVSQAIGAFLSQNDGDGWHVPESLCLADYGLGHDDRAKRPQPVAERLGPCFLDWQLAQDPDESWRECELHARNLLGETGYAARLKNPQGTEGELEPNPAEPEPMTWGKGRQGLLY